MKKVETFVKEYISNLSDENLKFFDSRLGQRLGGDVAEAVEFLSQANEMDRWLSTAKGAWDFYDMIDMFAKVVELECQERECKEGDKR